MSGAGSTGSFPSKVNSLELAAVKLIRAVGAETFSGDAPQ